jgi:hypothetical protein
MLRVRLVEVFEAELATVWPVFFSEVPDFPLIPPRDQLRHVTRSVYAVEARPVMRRMIAPPGLPHPVAPLPEPDPPPCAS